MFRLSTAAASAPRLLLCGVAGLLAVACAFSTLTLGYADLEFRRGDQTGAERAVRLAPLDAGYLARWSELTDNREAAIDSLKAAVASNPWYGWAWIQLGLTAEQAGQASLAERDLLQAAAVDRGFAPRWALCNYYFRSGKSEQFWHWTREALATEETQSLPVLRLAWRMSPDTRTILERAVPPSDAARHSFLRFLAEEHPLGTDFSAVATLFSTATRDDIPVLDSYAQALLNAGEVAHAVVLWNAMCDRRLLPFHGIHEEQENLLTNADFASAPSGRVFDWRFMPVEGIALENHSPGEFDLMLSGSEPEHWRILSQQVPVQPGKRYELGFQARLQSGGSASGLRWKILEGLSRDKVLAESKDPAAVDFTPAASLVTIALDYDRPRGAVRLTGRAIISGLTLRALNARTVRTP